MTRKALRLAIAIVAIADLLLVAACVGGGGSAVPGTSAVASAPGPQGAEEGPSRRQPWLIPSPQPGLPMRATLHRPPGEGPFPLAVVNHGSDQDTIERQRMPLPEFPAITDWLLAHGYAVLLPQRPGHGETGGRYLEDQGRCGKADYTGSGRATADSIQAAIDFMTKQSFIRPAGVVIVGNSAGGWGAVALAARNPANVRAVVVFASGRGGRNRGRADSNCSPERLVAAAAEFGKTARVPTLWLYAENDSYFPPELSRRVAEAYAAAGADSTYVLLPPVGAEGHGLIETKPPAAAWTAPVERFLGGSG